MTENSVLFALAVTVPPCESAVWITWMVLKYRGQQRNADRNAAKAAALGPASQARKTQKETPGASR